MFWSTNFKNLNSSGDYLSDITPIFYYVNRLDKDAESLDYELNQVDDGTYILHDAPGFTKDDINLEFENGYLTIEGERKYKINKKEKTRKFKTKIKLGDVSGDLEATIENGILSVFVPNYKKNEKKTIKVF